MTADEARPERLHPLAVLSGLGRSLRNLVGAIAAGGYFAFQGWTELGLLILGSIAVLSTTGLLLHWWRFSYRVGEDSIRIDSGILSRNQRVLPFDRVQDVSIAQGPVQRLVGVARVTLETGSSTAGKEEGVLDAIALDRARALRDHVRARRGIAVAANPGIEVDSSEEAALFTMDGKRLLILGLFNFSLALFAGLFGASQTFGDLFDIDPFERDFWQPILLGSGLSDWLIDHPVGLILGGLTVLILAGIVTGMIRTILREHGFRLERAGNGLRRRRGLLTRTDVLLPLRRVQAGIVSTGPIREHFGWRAFGVQSLASDSGEGKEGGDHMLAPLARDEELERVAGELGWALPEPDLQWRPVSKAHVWTFCLMLAPLFPLLILLGPLRWLEWRRTAFAIDDRRLLLRTGWWQRRTLLLPLRNVQSADLFETSLTRWFGIASVAIGTAGGRTRGHVIPSLPREEASLLRRLLLSQQP